MKLTHRSAASQGVCRQIVPWWGKQWVALRGQAQKRHFSVFNYKTSCDLAALPMWYWARLYMPLVDELVSNSSNDLLEVSWFKRLKALEITPISSELPNFSVCSTLRVSPSPEQISDSQTIWLMGLVWWIPTGERGCFAIAALQADAMAAWYGGCTRVSPILSLTNTYIMGSNHFLCFVCEGQRVLLLASGFLPTWLDLNRSELGYPSIEGKRNQLTRI